MQPVMPKCSANACQSAVQCRCMPKCCKAKFPPFTLEQGSSVLFTPCLVLFFSAVCTPGSGYKEVAACCGCCSFSARLAQMAADYPEPERCLCKAGALLLHMLVLLLWPAGDARVFEGYALQWRLHFIHHSCPMHHPECSPPAYAASALQAMCACSRVTPSL
jgi:hypothetical protein